MYVLSGREAPSQVAPQEVTYPVPAEMQGQVFYFVFAVIARSKATWQSHKAEQNASDSTKQSEEL